MATSRFWHILFVLWFILPLSNQLWATPPELNFNNLTEGFSGSYPYIRALMEDQAGFIWIGSDGGGLYRYDRCELKAYMANVENPHAISSNEIISLYQDRSGIIWVGTNSGGINRFDPQKGQFSDYYHIPPWRFSIYSHNIVWSISEDDKGKIWLGTNFGLNSFDPDSEEFQSWLVNDDRDRRENAINSVLPDKSRKQWLWLGTNAGLIGFDSDTETFTSYVPPFWNPPVEDIFQEPGGALWLATRGGGMVYFDPVTNTWEQYMYEIALRPDEPEDFNAIFQMELADDGVFWLATRKQIKAFNPKTKTYFHFPPNDGDTTSAFNAEYFSILLDKHGMVWGGSYNGLSMSQQPVTQKPDPGPPRAVITALWSGTKKIESDKPFIYVDTLMLDHRDRNFSLSCATINAAPFREVEYAYQMQSKDREFAVTGDRAALDYRLFWGGEYIFRIKARYKDEEWGPERTLLIDLEVPYWQKWWFSALILVSLGSIAFALYSFYLRQKKEKERLEAQYKNQLMEMEMSALRSQMNPHFLFNSLNSIKHFIIKNNPREASRYLTKFSQLMRQILNNSRTPSVSLADELKALKLYVELEGLRFDNKFSYTAEYDESLDMDSIQIPPLILQPYVENAIWHGLMHKKGDGIIQIQVQKNCEHLHIAIEDNGVGREMAMLLKSKTSTRRKSHGMQITSDRLALVEEVNEIKTSVEITDLKDESGAALGTRVDIMIPLEKALN